MDEINCSAMTWYTVLFKVSIDALIQTDGIKKFPVHLLRKKLLKNVSMDINNSQSQHGFSFTLPVWTHNYTLKKSTGKILVFNNEWQTFRASFFVSRLTVIQDRYTKQHNRMSVKRDFL